MPYSLGKLGYAVGKNAGDTSLTKLAVDGRGSAALTKMSQFIGTPSAGGGNTTIIADATSTMWMNFGAPGSLFMSRIANRTQNFGTSWTFLVGPTGGTVYHYNPNEASSPLNFGTCSIYNGPPGPGDYDEYVQFLFNDHYNGSTVISFSPYIDIYGGES